MVPKPGELLAAVEPPKCKKERVDEGGLEKTFFPPKFSSKSRGTPYLLGFASSDVLFK